MPELNMYFTNKKTFTTTLLAILYDKYNAEFMEWDPIALALQIRDDFGVDVPSSINDKIQAGCTLFTSNAFHTNLETFSNICNVLNFELISNKHFIPADIEDCSWGCTEAKLLEGQSYDTDEFSENIKNYVGFMLNKEGLYKPPSMLKFANYPAKTLEDTQHAWADDEIMYGVFWDKQQEKKGELERLVQQRMSDLFAQLKNLPLKRINSNFIGKVLAELHRSLTAS